jgi:signal transduction histidine kinase
MSIQLTLAPGLPRVVGDPERIQQIVFNLLDNAYNYTPERGRITVGAHLQGAEVQVDIQDTGIGIPPAEQERVFERFYRGEDPLVLATAGTGLGLSIVRYLIEAHGGRVWIESAGLPGQGTLISFTLPRYTAETET